nr:glucose dehydrogenase [uncultured bacterium]
MSEPTTTTRTALITGAGRGIGRAISLALAAAGYRVALSARSRAELEGTSCELEERGGQSLLLNHDLADPLSAGRIVGTVLDRWGSIDVLVNNAGIGSSHLPRPIVDFDDNFWDLTFAVNVKAPYLLTKHILPDMLAKGWGRIINIASINATIPAIHASAYVASKHALAGLTKATAKEVAGTGVTCNAICPGVTATQMNDLRLAYDSERLGKSIDELEEQASPLGRRLQPDEIAPLAIFLASDGGAAVNGQLINVCGGTVIV